MARHNRSRKVPWVTLAIGAVAGIVLWNVVKPRILGQSMGIYKPIL